jgi:hypothetical protein
MHIRASELEHVCEVEVVWKAKYLDFGSARRVARDAGMDVTVAKHRKTLQESFVTPPLSAHQLASSIWFRPANIMLNFDYRSEARDRTDSPTSWRISHSA